jgi:large subunit ribosomal protein L23
MKDHRSVLVRPILTEKSVAKTAQRKYTFEVAKGATKVEIQQAVEKVFSGTRVARVNTITVHGKRRRMGGYGRRRGRAEGHTISWKKAIVTLSAGTIPAFEGL